jgi:hypothetical protein
MTENSISKIEGVKAFLEREGWTVELADINTSGLYLFSHPDFEGCVLSLPSDPERFPDWEKMCEATLDRYAALLVKEKAEIAGSNHLIVSEPSKTKRVRAGDVIAFVLAFLVTGLLWNQVRPSSGLSAAHAGCMDQTSSLVVEYLAYDAYHSVLSPEELRADFAFMRYRAMQTAALAEEMRGCYLQAQQLNPTFDRNGSIGREVSQIEESVKTVYANIGFSLEGKASPSATTTTSIAYVKASSSSKRISQRLSQIISDHYF